MAKDIEWPKDTIGLEADDLCEKEGHNFVTEKVSKDLSVQYCTTCGKLS